MHQNIFDNDDIQLAMDSMLLPAVKQKIISGVSLQSVYTIQNDVTGRGRQIRNSLEDDFRRYGLSLRAVAITGINILEDGIERLKKFEDKNAEGIIDTKGNIKPNRREAYELVLETVKLAARATRRSAK